MSYTMGLDPERPAPAGIMAFSGFIPTVDGWQPSTADRTGTRVFVAHGRRDPVIGFEFAERATAFLEAAGLPVEFHVSDAAHHIDPAHVPAAVAWLGATLAG
jgi:phospholipase/carboxylesterase